LDIFCRFTQEACWTGCSVIIQDNEPARITTGCGFRARGYVGEPALAGAARPGTKGAKRPGIVDVKGIGKTDVFKGTHEEVPKAWKTWSYKSETWFSSQWGTGQTALEYARKKGDRSRYST